MNKARAAELLKKPTVHPITLDRIMGGLYPEWIIWLPETLESAVRSITAQNAVDPLVLHKLSAIQTVHNNEGPWVDWEVFNWINQPFNDELANFQYARRPDLDDLYVTVSIMDVLRKREFDPEVKHFIAAACLDAGVLFVPPPLDFVQPILDIVEYRCSVCGNVDEDTDNDMCDRCRAPQSALIKYPVYYDWKDVQKRWDEVKDSLLSDLQTSDSIEDVQIQKLAGVFLTLAGLNKQLKEELAYVSAP